MIADRDIYYSRRQGRAPARNPTEQELLQIGIRAAAPGVLALSGFAALLFRKIENSVLEFARSLDAEECVFPGSVAQVDLQSCGYLQRFPHFVRMIGSRNELMDDAARACCSAVCLSCYPLWKGARISGSAALTSFGRAIREESAGYAEYGRLSEFHMREIVFIGEADFVESRLKACMEWLRTLILDAELCAEIRVAEDPFFGDRAESLKSYQRLSRSKFELQLVQELGAKPLALASVNEHGEHFSKSFDIRLQNEEFACSGCFGLGIERLILALVKQHGADPAHWSPGVRRRFGA